MKRTIMALAILGSFSLFANTSIPSYIQKALDLELNKNQQLQYFYDGLNKKYGCFNSGDLIINCEISLKIEDKNITLINYQYSHSPYILNQTYRSFHFVFNQGTQPFNEVVFTVDYKVTTTIDEATSKEIIQAEVVSFSEL